MCAKDIEWDRTEQRSDGVTKGATASERSESAVPGGRMIIGPKEDDRTK